MTDELAEARAAMEIKLKRKNELLAELRAKSQALDEARAAMGTSMPSGGHGRSPQKLTEEIDRIEFTIATSAFTPAQEKLMIQRLDVVKQELAQTMADKETWGQFQAARAEMRAKAEERKAVRDQLDALRGELEQTYQSILKLSAERREQFKEREARRERAPPSERRSGGDFRGGDFQERRRQREEERKEMEPYLKEIDPFVSMDEIAEIKKKPKGGEESASAEGSQAAE